LISQPLKGNEASRPARRSGDFRYVRKSRVRCGNLAASLYVLPHRSDNSGRHMARKHAKRDPYGDLPGEAEEPPAVPCWLCGRPTGKTLIWHHPVPKSRGGREVVPMHPICQQTLIANFTNSELQRHGIDVEGLLANPAIRKFVDWVANKDPDFTAPQARKQR
jgi:hypothetical protein